MRFSRLKVSAMLLSVVTAGSLCTACSGGSSSAAGETASYTIGVTLPSQLQRRWAFDAKYMTEAAEQAGDKVIVQYANNDPSTQNNQVENLLSQGVDVLVIAAVDSSSAATAVERAKAQGVPVIAYDVGLQSADVDLEVTRDNTQVGTLQAKAAIAAHPSGNFAIVRGDSSNSVAQQIGNEAARVLGDAGPSVNVVSDTWTTGWSTETALADAENVLSRNNDNVAAFVVSSDNMAGGVVQALKGRQLNGKVFVSGLDAEPAALALVATGDQTMTVFTNLQEEAAAAARGARELAAKQPVTSNTTLTVGSTEVPVHQIDSIAIDQSNLCEFITKTAPPGWVTVADVYPNDPSACAAQ